MKKRVPDPAERAISAFAFAVAMEQILSMSSDSDDDTQPKYWRDKAARALRLAHGMAGSDLGEKLRLLAADYLQRSRTLSPRAVQQQQQQQQQQPPSKTGD